MTLITPPISVPDPNTDDLYRDPNNPPIAVQDPNPQESIHDPTDPNNTPIPPELQLPPPVKDPIRDPNNPPSAVQDPTPHDNQRPPPIPPRSIGYKNTSMKDLEKKHRDINKSISPLQRQLDKLNNQKAHIESCLNFFETDQTGFMNTYQPPTPATSPEERERDSSLPPPIPPRPTLFTLWEHLGCTLFDTLPKDNVWSCSHSCTRTGSHHSDNTGHSTGSTEDPLPEPFSLFGHSSPLSISYSMPLSFTFTGTRSKL